MNLLEQRLSFHQIKETITMNTPEQIPYPNLDSTRIPDLASKRIYRNKYMASLKGATINILYRTTPQNIFLTL